MLTQPRLKELLDYNTDTGIFTRKVSVSINTKIGDIVGGNNGYINIDYRRYQSHRLAFLYINGVYPAGRMFRIDGNQLNNRISNLRHIEKEDVLTQAYLKETLRYDADTGVFTKKYADIVIGSQNSQGYIQIRINDKQYTAHRLAWMYMTGDMPCYEIDHKDGNRSNNRINNLRHVNSIGNKQNQRRAQSNNKCGYLGVNFHKAVNKYQTQICIKGKIKSLGYFPSGEEAYQIYLKAKRELHETCTI